MCSTLPVLTGQDMAFAIINGNTMPAGNKIRRMIISRICCECYHYYKLLGTIYDVCHAYPRSLQGDQGINDEALRSGHALGLDGFRADNSGGIATPLRPLQWGRNHFQLIPNRFPAIGCRRDIRLLFSPCHFRKNACAPYPAHNLHGWPGKVTATIELMAGRNE